MPACSCLPACLRYVEPPAAVPLNNELAAARGELYGAEEAVLWRLTGDVGDSRYALQDTLDKVGGYVAILAGCARFL